MERRTVYLTADQKRALKRAARATGRTEAELIRQGVDIVTEAHRATAPQLPLFDTGRTDLASNVDDLLEGFGEA